MLHANFFGTVPVGGIVGWLKTYGQKSDGTNTSTTANQLIDSAANFTTEGVKDWMIVKNNNTAGCGTMQSGTNRPTGWSYVISGGVCSTTVLVLKEDIFPVVDGTGKQYYVYATPFLPENFVECNGQTLADTESILDGLVIPDLNACAGTSRFLRGKTTSGATGGTETHSHNVASHNHSLNSHTHTVPGHTHTVTPATLSLCHTATGPAETFADDTLVTSSSTALTTDAAAGNTGTAAPATDAIGTLPSYFEVVHILRIK